MKVIRRGPNKFWIFIGGKAFVLRIDRELQLVPHWRMASGLFLSALFAGAAFGIQQPLLGFPMLMVALLCLWGLSR